MRTLTLFIFLIAISAGCNDRERQDALDQRAAALDQREQELILRETTIQLKEEEYKKKL